MKLLTTRNNLLKYKNTPFDGQDYETAAHLIAGRQYEAAANFIDTLDSLPRDTMKTIIAKSCKTVFIEMFNCDPSLYADELGFFNAIGISK